MRNADATGAKTMFNWTTEEETKLTKIDTGYYTLRINGRPTGHVELNSDTNEWEGHYKGGVVEVGRTRSEAVFNMALRFGRGA